MKEQAFILGVNYWPQRTAMFMWREFEREVIKEDLAIIHDLGISCVRISLIWEDFQPEPKKIPAIMLDRLVDFLEMAGDKNLEVMVTLFTGHTSGLNWLPPWMLLASAEHGQYQAFSMGKVRTNKIRNPYSDTEIIEAQIFFLRELMSGVSGHPALSAWNLGNTPSIWSLPPDEFSAELWLQAMTETLKEKDDTIPLTLGLHAIDLTENSGLRPGLVAKYLDYSAVHVQPQALPWVQDPHDAALPPFLGCLVAWLGKIPVLIQEFGLATKPVLPMLNGSDVNRGGDLLLLSEEDAARITEDAMAGLRRFKIMGGFWKTYGDYHPSIWRWPPLDQRVSERFFGLVRYDGSPKLVASIFKSKPTELAEDEVLTDWIDLSEEDYYRDSKQQLSRLYRRFREYYSFE